MANEKKITLYFNGTNTALKSICKEIITTNEQDEFFIELERFSKEHNLSEETLYSEWGFFPVREEILIFQKKNHQMRWEFYLRGAIPFPVVERISKMFPDVICVMTVADYIRLDEIPTFIGINGNFVAMDGEEMVEGAFQQLGNPVLAIIKKIGGLDL